MAAQYTAEDFEDVHLPVEITVESYDTLLILLSSNEPSVLMPVVSALRDQISDESYVKLTLPRIVDLAGNCKNDQVQIVLSWYLADLALSSVKNSWAFDLLSKEKAVPHLVRYAKSFDVPAMSEKAFEALVALSADIVTAKEIEACGALDVFKEALKKEDPAIQSQVSLALYRLSADFENRKQILSSGLFMSLLEFLSSEDLDEEVLGNALQAVSQLLLEPESVVFFEEQTAWKYIFPFLDDSDKTIQTYAYSIIAKISGYEAFQYHFDDELLNRFITALNDLEEFDPVVPSLLIILRNCCKIPFASKSLAVQIPLLLDRVFSDSTGDEQKVVIMDTIAKLSEDANTHSAILEPEQLARICKSINNVSLRNSVLTILSSICENRSIRAKLHEFGAIEALVEIMHETDKIDVQSIVLPMVFKIIGDSKLQSMVIQNSIPDLAVYITSEFPDIQNTALLILATISVDSTARETISKMGDFMKNLIGLISSKKVAIRRNTLHALNSLAIHRGIATSLCEFGVIEKLKKFASSSAMINLNLSAFATTALDTICKSNIVAKFWVHNELSFTDELYDGFYTIDPRSETYRSLDSLFNDVIHLRLESLLLDAERDPGLKEAVQSLADSFIVKTEQAEQTPAKKKGKKQESAESQQQSVVIPEWPHIAVSVAKFVINRMGGPFQNNRIQYESEVSRCKYRTHSDVVMLGQLNVGTIRHRALLFKYLAAKYGMETEIVRNKEDLTCTVRVKKDSEILSVDLSGASEEIVK